MAQTQVNKTETSNTISCNITSCLICDDTRNLVNLYCVDLFDKSEYQNNEVEGILKPHLWSMFVLTRVLEYPSEKCSEILLKTSGVSNPGDWFTLCHQCSTVVNKAYQVTRQVRTLERKLKDLRNELAVKLGKSLDKEPAKITNDETFVLNIRSEIRNHFRPAEITATIKVEGVPESASSPLWSLSLDDNFTEAGTAELDFKLDSDVSPSEDDSHLTKQFVNHLRDKKTANNACAVSSKHSKLQVSKKTTTKLNGRSPGAKTETKITTFRHHNWLQSSDDESKRKWKPIDKELYQIYQSFPSDSSTGPKIPCPICGYSYIHIRQHLLAHRARFAQFACSICKYGAKNQISFDHHLATRHKELGLKNQPPPKTGPQQCSICKRLYCNDKKLRVHLRMHKKYSQTSCSTCHFPCETQQQLERHIKKWHSLPKVVPQLKKRGPYKKKGANEKTPDGKRQADELCKTKKDFKCSRCDYVAERSTYLKWHEIRHSVMENGIKDELTGSYCCKVCAAKFNNDKSFVNHFSHVHKSEILEHLFLCHHCDKGYTSSVNLNRHIKKVHVNQVRKNQRNISCDLCIRKFWNKIQLDKHKAQNHPNSPGGKPRSVCEQCGLSFSRKGVMRDHQRRFHPGLYKPIRGTLSRSSGPAPEEKKCKHCTMTCVNLNALTEHMKVAHPHLYKFRCTLCPAKYISGFYLRLHVKSCHEQSKVTCIWCGAQMKPYSMPGHLKTNCKQNPKRNPKS